MHSLLFLRTLETVHAKSMLELSSCVPAPLCVLWIQLVHPRIVLAAAPAWIVTAALKKQKRVETSIPKLELVPRIRDHATSPQLQAASA